MDLSIFLNTNSIAKDCWGPFMLSLEKHWPGHPPLVIGVDSQVDLWNDLGRAVQYSPSCGFGHQYLQGLSGVTTEFVLPMLEDMVLYGDVNTDHISGVVQHLEQSPEDDFVRLIDSGRGLAYSLQPTIWRTESLLNLYVKIRHEKTPWEAEQVGHLRGSFLRGTIASVNGKQRGRSHYDSLTFPVIATALTRGKWNKEYEEELSAIHEACGIDASKRGWT